MLLVKEALAAGIVLTGIGVMLRLVSLRGALLIIASLVLFVAFLPQVGMLGENAPAWALIIILVVLGINLLRAILRGLFNKEVADSFTSKLLYGIASSFSGFLINMFKVMFRIK